MAWSRDWRTYTNQLTSLFNVISLETLEVKVKKRVVIDDCSEVFSLTAKICAK